MNTTGMSGGNGLEVSSDATQPTSTIVPTGTPDNSSSLQITSFKLSGRNFLAWSRFVQLVIRG